jgi:hypothetical protein
LKLITEVETEKLEKLREEKPIRENDTKAGSPIKAEMSLVREVLAERFVAFENSVPEAKEKRHGNGYQKRSVP